jgi:methyl-accepting chemotaxis protein
MKRGKPLMTPQEIQRMMDFILRSHADAMIRMDQWEEKFNRDREEHNERLDRIERNLDKLAATVREVAVLSRKAFRETEKQQKKTKTLERSTRSVKRRSESMTGLMKMAMRLLAHQSKRLDALENR